MLFSFGVYDVWTGDNTINGSLGFNAHAKSIGITSEKVQSVAGKLAPLCICNDFLC